MRSALDAITYDFEYYSGFISSCHWRQAFIYGESFFGYFALTLALSRGEREPCFTILYDCTKVLKITFNLISKSLSGGGDVILADYSRNNCNTTGAFLQRLINIIYFYSTHNRKGTIDLGGNLSY